MWGEDPNPMLGATLPKTLMAISMLTVPCMLLPKPMIKLVQNQRQEKLRAVHSHGHHAPVSFEEGHTMQGKTEEEEEFDFMEMFIHQIIETIEYVLGTVSHTASYLRLWALSLAHQQLSVVFFNMTILGGMGVGFPWNIFTIYFTFFAWFVITVGILLGMDTLECFLHTLRLHWVEFQSKFYKADGQRFEPYSHKELLTAEGGGLS